MDTTKKKNTTKERAFSLNEAVADITYIAGYRRFYGGDSRQDIGDFISWAQEFENIWKDKDWGADDTMDDYMDEIGKFANEKITEARKSLKKNG